MRSRRHPPRTPRVPRWGAHFPALFLALAASVLAAACSRTPEGPRNALLVTLDTTRADALGCYGGNPGVTPVLDELARESLRYEAARTVAPITLPAHASMLTGLYPPRHGVRDNAHAALPPSAATVAEAARAAGFQTAAFVASTALDHAFGLDQGFEVYRQPPRSRDQDESHYRELSAGEVTRLARWWLGRRDRSRPFFAWVHYYDPHAPYAPPDTFLARAGGDPYLGEVALMDASLGELIAALRAEGELERTLLIVVADHGEGLYEHGEPTHGVLCYDSTLRVPMLVRYPDGWRAGESSWETVTVADVHPTLLEALDLGAPGGVDGVSLYRRTVPEDRGVYFESYAGFLNHGWSPIAGWIDASGKYIHGPEPELYDPRRDPAEERNLLSARPDQAERYRRAIDEVAARPQLAAADDAAVGSDLLKELLALGYAGAAPGREVPHPLEDTGLPNPASRTEELQQVLLANLLGDQGKHEEAVEILREILEKNPRELYAMDFLGFNLMRLERFDEAREVFERRLAQAPRHAVAHLNLATCLEKLGDDEGALEELEVALAIDPESYQALLAAAAISERAGDLRRAEEYRQRLARLTAR